jgi:hypothetical protein
VVGINNSELDFELKVLIRRISEAVMDISLSNDRVTFIDRMIFLSNLLMNYDIHISPAFRVIDEKAQDPTYFFTAFIDTNNLEQALWIHRIIRHLTRYILLYDRFFEKGNNDYKLLARSVRKSLNELLLTAHEDHLYYSIDFSLKQFWTFWKFEKLIKCRINEGRTFSYNEIKYFNQFKSSDASIVYANVLAAKLPSFNENVSVILHYNQALLDILDDWEDIEDDVRDDMPNMFVMAVVGIVPYNRIKNTQHLQVRRLIMDALDLSSISVIGLIDEYQAAIKDIFVPNNLNFLKIVSDHHVEKLKNLLSSR